MSRAFVALFLVASLVSGVLFFTPNYSAEYDEDFYEYQPYLSYHFNLHELDWNNYDENDTYEFSGSVYMRREYSNEESETFRKLLVKSYQLSILDQQYRTEVVKLLGDAANGTADNDDVLETQYFYVSAFINQNSETNDFIESDIKDQLQIVTEYLNTTQLVIGFMLDDQKRDLLN